MNRKKSLAIVLASLALYPHGRGDEPAFVRNWVAAPYWQPGAVTTKRWGSGRAPLGIDAVPSLSAPLPFIAVTPCRIVDTRSGSGPYAGPILAVGTPRSFDVVNGPCPGIPSASAAYSLNVTVTASPLAAPGSYLTVWATGEPVPSVSTLNYGTGQTIANAAIVPAGAGGAFSVVTNASTHLIVDINGYYAPPPDAVAAGAGVNPLQIAALRWYAGNKSAPTFAVGSFPVGVAFDGASVWVTSNGDDKVTRLRASDGLNLGSYPTGGAASGVAFDGANVWVAVNQGASGVATKLRASDGANVGTFPVGANPKGVAFDGTNVWVTNQGGGSVTKIRASDGANQGTFTVGVNPNGVAFDGSNVWIANQGSASVTKLRASDGANLGTFAVGADPVGVAFDGANVWVTESGTGNVTRLRSSDGMPLGSFPVGTSPAGVAFDGSNIWVASTGGNAVIKLRASDGSVLGSFTVASPTFIAFDGANVWVSNASGGTVTKL